MTVSAAQCRAARGLLDWTQDQLAESARVARATIADFERNVRVPMRNNLASIRAALEVAGIAFVEENGGGAGVRFRKVELEYSRDFRADMDGVALRVRHRGKRYFITIPSEVIDDLDHTTYGPPEEMREAVEKKIPLYLRAIEDAISSGPASDRIRLSYDHFPVGPF